MNGPSHSSRSQREVLPGRRRRLHPLAVGAEERRRRAPGGASSGTVRSGEPPGARPARRASAAGRAPRARSAPSSCRSSCSGIVGLPQSRPCENVQSSVTISPAAPAARARSTRAAIALARARPVDLEERLRVGRDDLLDRLARERAQAHRRPARRRRAGDGHLAVGVHRLHAGRRDAPPAATICLAHHGRRQVALGRQPGDVRREAELAERRRRCRSVSAALRPGDQTPCRRSSGSALRARRCASATDSNQRSAIRAASRPARSASGLSSHGAIGRGGARREWSAGGRGGGRGRARGEQRLAVAEHALGVRPVERQPGEELRRHAAAAARVVHAEHDAHAPPVCGSRRSWNSSDSRQTAREAAASRTLPARNVVVDRERARVDVADRVDQADDAAGAAQVQARQRLRRRRRGGRTSRRSAPPRRARAASRRARAAAPRSGAARPRRPRRAPTAAAG